VSVIDSPGVPEKKSFPPRLLLTLALTLLATGATAGGILLDDRWTKLDPGDPRRMLVQGMLADTRTGLRGNLGVGRVRR